MKINELKLEFTKHIPEQMEEGILYISEDYHVSIHLCACGCKNQTVLPFGAHDNGWNLTFDSDKTFVTIRPSIGNFQFNCKSHYYITKNKIDWL